jgi:hypothetical protein
MGDVYAGRHPLIGKRVAIKVIKRHLAASPDAIERFLREARAVNQVDHPNVIDIFAVGRLDDGRLYLVMDLLEGESLGARIARGKVPVEETLTTLAAIAGALDAAHGRGVIHRDLKPDNVFVAEDRVYVLDFGIAKLLATSGAAAPGTLTDQGTWLGTPAYMAPEQWGADGAGPASDRYALGVIAFEMLSGKPPFQATSLPAMMEKHFRAPVPSLGASIATSAVDRVLARAMAKDPDDRYPSAGAMVEELRTALGTAAGPRATDPPTGRRPVLVAVLGGATVVAAVITGIYAMRSPGQRHAAAPAPAPVGAPPRDVPVVAVTSTPSGAHVRAGGVDRGTTPVSIRLDDLGDASTLVIEKPGYTAVTRAVAGDPPAAIQVSLDPITRFEGVWALPDGALRAFERRGEQVAMFTLASASGARAFERFFAFTSGEPGQVDFVASEDHVDPRGADDPSCHVPLRAEYVYDPRADTLTRRQERAQIDFADGHCALGATGWGEAVRLRRLDASAEWAESSAGASRPTVVPKTSDRGQNQKRTRPAKRKPVTKEASVPADKPASQATRPAINNPIDTQQQQAPQRPASKN